MNIIYAADDNYVPLLSVSLQSLLENNKDNNLVIYILSNNINSENKTKLKNQVNDFNKDLIFIDVDVYDNLKNSIKGSRLPLSAYSRLFLTELIPNLDKALYIDCDTLIVNDLKELYEKDIENYYCAAVIDLVPSILKRKIGFNESDPYINSGVLLINLNRWKKEDIIQKFIDFISKFGDDILIFDMDQSVINGVCKDKILFFDSCYNFVSYYHFNNYEGIAELFAGEGSPVPSKDAIKYAQKNPTIIHFLGCNSSRPWFYSKNPYRNLFESYANASPYSKEVFAEDGQVSVNDKIHFLLLKYSKFFSKIIPLGWWRNRRDKIVENVINDILNKQ